MAFDERGFNVVEPSRKFPMPHQYGTRLWVGIRALSGCLSNASKAAVAAPLHRTMPPSERRIESPLMAKAKSRGDGQKGRIAAGTPSGRNEPEARC